LISTITRMLISPLHVHYGCAAVLRLNAHDWAESPVDPANSLPRSIQYVERGNARSTSILRIIEIRLHACATDA
jgi:hypothetical protein